ncbi:hypothetical protein PAPHI01_0742 [Pancytospora philotis]|nr:hypothetical protein PAPHI01_0742 [Pancytospora philotis]
MAALEHFHTYKTHTKLRWKGRALLDVLVSEFRTRSEAYYVEAISCGVITVNDERVLPTYRLKDLDVIYHTVHFHEPLAPKIDVIAREEEYTVLNKPAGIPVHPTGGYFRYTITKAMFDGETVGCVNRLDMPVSGVLIITQKEHTKAYELLKTAQKIYVAKVRGEFPERADVDRPIGTTAGTVHGIADDGKPSRTLFERIAYKNGYSLVRCQPITGRTHQIRIHLQYLGFPIINDKLYGVAEPQSAGAAASYAPCAADISAYEDRDKYDCIVRHCSGENNRSFWLKDSFICLHAWKYLYNDKTYEAPWPAWASLD